MKEENSVALSEPVVVASNVMPFELEGICNKLENADVHFTFDRVEVPCPRGDVFSKGGVSFYYQVLVPGAEVERAQTALMEGNEIRREVPRKANVGHKASFFLLDCGLCAVILFQFSVGAFYPFLLGWLAFAIMKRRNWARVTFLLFAGVNVLGVIWFRFTYGQLVLSLLYLLCGAILCMKGVAKEFKKETWGVLWGLNWWVVLVLVVVATCR